MSVLVITYSTSTSTSVTFNITGGGTPTTPIVLVDGVPTLNYTLGTTALTVYDLLPSNLYSFQYSTSEFFVSNLISASTLPFPPPTAPVLTTTSIGFNSATFSFTQLYATSYRVFVDSQLYSNVVVKDSTLSITGLEPQTTFQIQLEGRNQTGSSISAPIQITTQYENVTPTKPVIALQSATNTSLTFFFTTNNATSYSVFVGGQPFPYLTIDGNTFLLTNLLSGTFYPVIFNAINGANVSSSNVLIVQTTGPAQPPTTPFLNQVTGTTTTLSFVWTGGIGATSYTGTITNLPRNPDGSLVYTPTYTINPSAKTFNISGVLPNTSYSVLFTASNLVGSTQSIPFTTQTTGGPVPPSPPTTPVITFVSATSISLSYTFTGGAGATSYSALVDAGPNPPTTPVNPSNLVVSGSTFTIGGLLPSTQYSVVFICSNVAGSVQSTPNTQTTGSGPVPVPPTTPLVLTFASATATSLSYTFTGGVGATSYSATVNSSTVTPTVVGQTMTISGLTASTSYAVNLIAINVAGTVISNTVTESTSGTGGTVPTILALSFFLVEGTTWILDSGNNPNVGTWYLTGPNAGKIQYNGQPYAPQVVAYLNSVKATGSKVILSIAGGSANTTVLQTMFANPTGFAQSFANAFYDIACPNPLGFQSGDWAGSFIFDGIDLDIEANTPTTTDAFTFLTALKALAPTKLVTAAPQAPNTAGSAYPNGLTANGTYSAYPTTTSSLSTLNLAPSTAIISTTGCAQVDYFFVQFYNQGFYIGDPAFAGVLAQWGFLCLNASPRKCKIIIGVASSDGSPIWTPSSPTQGTAALTAALTAANTLITNQATFGSTQISDWCAGAGAWVSPSAVPALTQIYSATGVLNLPTTAAMTYSSPSGLPTGWSATTVPIPVTR